MITAAQEQQILANQSSRLDELINRKGEPGPPGFGRGFRFGPGGPPPGGPPSGGPPPAGSSLPGPAPGPPPLPY
jgi:hypothetical protein